MSIERRRQIERNRRDWAMLHATETPVSAPIAPVAPVSRFVAPSQGYVPMFDEDRGFYGDTNRRSATRQDIYGGEN